MRVPRSAEDTNDRLREQVYFLEASAAAYDAGKEGEAKRLAAALRILLHDTPRSHSLLCTMGLKSVLRFHDVVGAVPPRAVVFIGLNQGFEAGGMSYYPKLGHAVRELPFNEWWEAAVVIQANANVRLTRRDAILNVADTDGGAHVDPSLDAAYAAVSRHNAVGWEVWVDEKRGQVLNGPYCLSCGRSPMRCS